MARPLHCRPAAYNFFARQMPELGESSDVLLNAALAISMHELESVDPAAVTAQMQRFADIVRRRVPRLVDRLRSGRSSMDIEPVLAHLHSVLFDEAGFIGNAHDYYNPHNSYISEVLHTRRGIPISLALIYKNIAERLGLVVYGINAPGHFLAAVDVSAFATAGATARSSHEASQHSGLMYIDPFVGGLLLTPEEAFRRIELVLDRSVPRDDRLLAPASHRQWLSRMLQNLQMIFAVSDREDDTAAMQELEGLLTQSR